MKPIFIILICLTVSGCSSLSFYYQSVAGQMELLVKREPINEILEDPEQNAELKAKLAMVLEMRTFASEHLALPNNDSYRSYVDLGRPYVLWNVFAAPEFSFDMKQWCFPVAGCVNYRGYFTEADAKHYADQLATESYDVYVGGVPAYSTLGWFDDPVLNTIIRRSEIRLAGLLFHELAHQQLYVPGDTAFNEGFATAVEEEGVKRWLSHRGAEVNIEEIKQQQQRHKDFVELVGNVRDRLKALYKLKLADTEMRARKKVIIADMLSEYEKIKTRWDGYNGYDRWFAKDINNAQLAAVATYQDYVPAFSQLLQQHGGDFRAFYQAAAELAELEKPEREHAIQKLLSTRQTTHKTRPQMGPVTLSSSSKTVSIM